MAVEAPFSYIERSIETVSGIDPDKLAQGGLGPFIGGNAIYTSKAYSLGHIDHSHDPLHLALKLVRHPNQRVLDELRDLDILAARAPELIPKLPYFLGLVALKGRDRAIGILTEDASRGTVVNSRDTITLPGTLNEFVNAFLDAGGSGAFSWEMLEYHVSFKAGKEERLLDFYPTVFSTDFKIENSELYVEAFEKAMDAVENKGVTVEIDAKSPLAQAIADRT